MRKYILTLLMGAAVLTGCLDVDIVDRVEKEEKFFKTEEHATAAINGVYNILFLTGYHKTNWPLILCSFEDCMFTSGNDISATVSLNTHNASAGPIGTFWNLLYDGIKNANEVIKRVPAIEFKNPADKSRIIAEAHFLRALYHYDLMRLYGGANGIPVITEPVTGIADAYHSQEPAAKVYEQIVKDFAYAAGENEDGTLRLPLRSAANYIAGRATNGAAHAFLAEVYLTMGEWEKAADEADIVIKSDEYQLVKDFRDLWNVDREMVAQSENIFAIPFFRDRDALSDLSLGSNVAFFYNPAGVSVGGELVCGSPSGKGKGNHRFQKWFIKYFQNDQGNLGYSDPTIDAGSDDHNLAYKDYRIEASFWRRYQERNNQTGVLGNVRYAYPASGNPQDNWGYTNKYIDPQGVNNATNENDMPRLRLADMYLIKAEALNELGKYSDACQALDMVRERARHANGMEREWPKYIGQDRPDNIGRTLDKQEFRWLVFMERGLEFSGEQKRWFDLIRMKWSDNTVMYDYMKDTFIPSLPAADVNKLGVMATRKKYLPIPFAEITRNPGVKQNPGY